MWNRCQLCQLSHCAQLALLVPKRTVWNIGNYSDFQFFLIWKRHLESSCFKIEIWNYLITNENEYIWPLLTFLSFYYHFSLRIFTFFFLSYKCPWHSTLVILSAFCLSQRLQILPHPRFNFHLLILSGIIGFTEV